MYGAAEITVSGPCLGRMGPGEEVSERSTLAVDQFRFP